MEQIVTSGGPSVADALLDGSFGRRLGLQPGDLRVGLDAAQALIRAGDPRRALTIYLGMVLVEPMNVDFQVGLADCALALGEAELALQAASVVLAIGSRSDPRGWFLSGRACLMMGAMAEARDDLSEAARHADAARQPALAEQARLLLALAEAGD